MKQNDETKETKCNQCDNKELKIKELLNIECSDVKISDLIDQLIGFQLRTNNMKISTLHLWISGFDSNGEKNTLKSYILK